MIRAYLTLTVPARYAETAYMDMCALCCSAVQRSSQGETHRLSGYYTTDLAVFLEREQQIKQNYESLGGVWTIANHVERE